MSIEFVEPLDQKKIIDMLISAYADEWIAAYYYTLTAYAIRGHVSEEISEHFLKEAEEEIEKHARMIADRLQDFNIDPPRDFRKLWEISGCKYPEIPEDPHDIDAWIIVAIKAEECAIKSYRDLYAYTHGRDPVTEELAEDIIRDEVRHRTNLINLLSKDGVRRLTGV
ncbi:MAG: ferritin-like domain-containing protein [Acidilobaceae archaeon]